MHGVREAVQLVRLVSCIMRQYKLYTISLIHDAKVSLLKQSETSQRGPALFASMLTPFLLGAR